MNRRAFIFSSSAVAVGIPAAYYFKKHNWKKFNPVLTPEFLSTILDESTIKEIGAIYLKMIPGENSKQQLKTAVLTDEKGTQMGTRDDAAVTAFINEKITKEFKTNNTLLVNGWILSLTEARQCALFSLTY